MLELLRLILFQIREAYSDGGIKKVIQTRLFFNRTAIPAVMDLSILTSFQVIQNFSEERFNFIEIKLDDLVTNKFTFVFPGRQLKALRNLRRGWRGFAVTDNSLVAGDMWCQLPGPVSNPSAHPDLEMLGIKSNENDVYAFDMFIAPAYRGKNLAVPLQKFMHNEFKKEGFHHVYGFYWKDNIPALWMHRMLKYRELPSRRISRFFFLVNSRNDNTTKIDQKNIQKSFSRE